MLQKKSNTISLGKLGEEYACTLLVKKGYKILDRNFRSRFGELDIIALDKDTLVFVEVKTRRSFRHGLPEEAVQEKKLEKIRVMGQLYNMKLKTPFKKLRIEVISLVVSDTKIIRERVIKVI